MRGPCFRYDETYKYHTHTHAHTLRTLLYRCLLKSIKTYLIHARMHNVSLADLSNYHSVTCEMFVNSAQDSLFINVTVISSRKYEFARVPRIFSKRQGTRFPYRCRKAKNPTRIIFFRMSSVYSQ